jgi:hypothetical protein
MAWWPTKCPGEPYLGYSVMVSLIVTFLFLPFLGKYLLLRRTPISQHNFPRLFLRVNAWLCLPTIGAAFVFSRNIASKKALYVDHALEMFFGFIFLIILAGIESWLYNRRLNAGIKMFGYVVGTSTLSWAVSLALFFSILLNYPGPETYVGYCWFSPSMGK